MVKSTPFLSLERWIKKGLHTKERGFRRLKVRRKDLHVHVIAILVLILIFGLWFCVGFLDWADNAVMMIVGASISGFTLIL